jgi:hypothetical protein
MIKIVPVRGIVCTATGTLMRTKDLEYCAALNEALARLQSADRWIRPRNMHVVKDHGGSVFNLKIFVETKTSARRSILIDAIKLLVSLYFRDSSFHDN